MTTETGNVTLDAPRDRNDTFDPVMIPKGQRRLDAPCRRSQDAIWVPALMALWTVNYRVYGAHKLWKAALRDGRRQL